MTGSSAPYNTVITYANGYVGIGQGPSNSLSYLQTTNGGATGGTGSFVPQYHLDITGTERVNGARIFGDNSAQVSAQSVMDYGTFGQNWTTVSGLSTSANWQTVAVSASGQYMTAGGNIGTIYYSGNYGQTWNSIAVTGNMTSIAMSASGQYQLVAAFGTNGIYYSRNFGASWTASNAPTAPQWYEVCMSTSGQFASACNATSTNVTYYSTDYGVTWTASTAVSPSGPFQGIACSASGQYQIAAIVSGIIYYSSNYGQSWTASNVSNAGGIQGASMSSSGQYAMVITNGTLGNVWYSSNYGVTFVSTAAGATSNNIRGSSMSASGQYQLAAGYSGGMYYSLNYGISWTLGSSTTTWFSASMSANGQYCLACIPGGAVYMSMTREPPKILANQNTNTSTGLSVLAPNIGTSNNIGIILGRDLSSNNYATMGFQYVGASSTNNYLYLGANTTTPTTLCITAAGQVGIGTTAPSDFFHVYGSAVSAMRVTTTATSDMMLMYGNIGGSSSTSVYVMPIRVGSTSTFVGGIQWSGSNLLYNNSSDYRLKENVVPMQHGLSRIMSLNPVTYNWIEHKTVGEGFIAHEVQSVIPMAVSGEKDAVHADGSIIPQGLDYSKIVVHLVSGMQEQQQLITALQTQVQQLQQRLG